MWLLGGIVFLVWGISDLVTGRANIARWGEPKVYFTPEDGSLYYLFVAIKLLGAIFFFCRYVAR